MLEAGFATVGRRLLHGGLSQLITATRTGLPDAIAAAAPRFDGDRSGPAGPAGAAVTTSTGQRHHRHRVPGLPDPNTLRP